MTRESSPQRVFYTIIFSLAWALVLGDAALAHDDSQPHGGRPPPHAQDTMRAFADDHHHNEHLAAQSITSCVGGFAGTYPCQQVDLMGFIPLDQLGGGNGNDVWGWTDAASGREFAIMGTTQGTSFVEISDPVNPVYLGQLPRPAGVGTSSWRDIKVVGDHAFIGSEALSSGLQVMHLAQLLNVPAPPVTFAQTALYTGFSTSHNIVANPDTGYVYAVGTNHGACSQGIQFIDVVNPASPVFAGCFGDDGYTHDAQCVVYNGPDSDWQGREICFAYNEDTLTIIDVTDKGAPVQISRTAYSQEYYTHQGWLTDDHRYLLMDDELDERNDAGITQTRTLVWDVEDLDNPQHIADHAGVSTSIDHNQYVVGNHVYQANYTSGLRILNLDDIGSGTLTEVGFFDIYPANNGTTFNGAWSVYPFFPSGNVVVSGIEQGLYVLRPTLAMPSDPPTVSITAPASGATVTGTVAVNITASDTEDADGTLDVDFNIDDGPWMPAAWNGSEYTGNWNSALAADGGHTITARAVDSDLREAQDSVNVSSANGPQTLTIDSVTVSLLAGKGNRNQAEAVVAVSDEAGQPLAGVFIQGDFSGGWVGSRSGTTGPDGTTLVNTPRVKNLSFSQFCVTDASLAGWSLAASGNTLCGDSNGGGSGPTGSVAGRVSDAGSGAAVAGAGVTLDSGQSGTTNGTGDYAIHGVPTGNHDVTVTASGYTPAMAATTVTDGGTSTVDFALTPDPGTGGSGAIRGTVTSSEGGRLSGATVIVIGHSSATTNKPGKYNIQGVPAGLQTIMASQPGYLPQSQDVTVTAGATLTVDFSLVPEG